MKKLFIIFLIFSLFFAASCTSGPEGVAEKYMELHCDLHKLYNEIDSEPSEKKINKLQKKVDKINQKMAKLNKRILSKYQGNESAMERIHTVVLTYKCED